MTISIGARVRVSEASQRRDATSICAQTVSLDLPRVYGITQNDTFLRQMRRVMRRIVARMHGCTRGE